MGKKSEKGNVIELVVIAVLVLAVVGLLVWRFAGNDTTTKTDSTTTDRAGQVKASDGDQLLDGSIDSRFGVALTFKYPKAWKIDQTYNQSAEDPTMRGGSTTLTSPSGDYVVDYAVSAGGGFGGYCSPDDEKGVYASFDYQALSGFSGVSYLETTVKNLDSITNTGGALNTAGLFRTEAAQNTKVGGSICTTYMAGIITLDEATNTELMSATITYKGMAKDKIDAATFKQAMQGTEYEQAKAILLSTSVK